MKLSPFATMRATIGSRLSGSRLLGLRFGLGLAVMLSFLTLGSSPVAAHGEDGTLTVISAVQNGQTSVDVTADLFGRPRTGRRCDGHDLGDGNWRCGHATADGQG